MISCLLQGGLGNQLFQIAAGYSLAINMNTQFGINHDYCNTPNQGHPSSKYKDNFYRKILEIDKIPSLIHEEPSFNYSPLPNTREITLKGYFQSEKYFKKNKENIINLFYPNNKYFELINPFKNLANEKKTVGVHIRRGDYLKFAHYIITTPVAYYKKAMSKFEDCNFIITSDDIEWTKENIVGDNIFYSPFNDEILDFCLLTSCDHNIIGNSSFSWWAAYLNKNINKTIIGPSQWFTEIAKCDISDLFPNNWIIIPS